MLGTLAKRTPPLNTVEYNCKMKEDDDEERMQNANASGKSTMSWSRIMMVEEVAKRLRNGDFTARIEAARDVRRLVRKSSSSTSKSALRCRLAAAGVIEPLSSMLHHCFPLAAREAALLAILNVAARNQRNKTKIVRCGAVPPLVELLISQTANLRELSAAAILSLSSVPSNKPTIASSGAASLLVHILCSGSVQAIVDAVTTLYNLSHL